MRRRKKTERVVGEGLEGEENSRRWWRDEVSHFVGVTRQKT